MFPRSYSFRFGLICASSPLSARGSTRSGALSVFSQNATGGSRSATGCFPCNLSALFLRFPPIFGIVTCVYISGRPLLSCPREWKIRHGHKTRAILLELLGGRKNTVFSRKCVHFGGFGEGYGGLMGVERRVFEGTGGFKEEGRLWRSGGRQRRLRTTAARKGSSKSSLWVRGRPGDGERLPAVAFFVLFRARFDTCHIQSGGASAPSHSYMCIKKRILLWMNTFLFLSGNTSLTVRRAVPPPCLQFLYRPHFAPSLPPFF